MEKTPTLVKNNMAKEKPVLTWDSYDVTKNQAEMLILDKNFHDHDFSYYPASPSQQSELEELWEASEQDTKKFMAAVNKAGLGEALKEQILASVYEDQDVLNDNWKWTTEYLTELLNKKNPKGKRWIVEGKDLGWTKASGSKVIDTNDGQELLDQILPKTENSFDIYETKDGFSIRNAHHDAPTGEWYYLSVMAVPKDVLEAVNKLGFEKYVDEYPKALEWRSSNPPSGRTVKEAAMSDAAHEAFMEVEKALDDEGYDLSGEKLIFHPKKGLVHKDTGKKFTG